MQSSGPTVAGILPQMPELSPGVFGMLCRGMAGAILWPDGNPWGRSSPADSYFHVTESVMQDQSCMGATITKAHRFVLTNSGPSMPAGYKREAHPPNRRIFLSPGFDRRP